MNSRCDDIQPHPLVMFWRCWYIAAAPPAAAAPIAPANIAYRPQRCQDGGAATSVEEVVCTALDGVVSLFPRSRVSCTVCVVLEAEEAVVEFVEEEEEAFPRPNPNAPATSDIVFVMALYCPSALFDTTPGAIPKNGVSNVSSPCICGNMNEPGSTSRWLSVGPMFPRLDDDVFGSDEGIGCSSDNRRSVSAPTIPPIECPIRKIWTEGSTVGDGVWFSTSKSMTLFCSLLEG